MSKFESQILFEIIQTGWDKNRVNVSLKVSRNENSQPSADCNSLILFGVPYGNRTRVAAVKGRCPRPLDERDAW